MNDIVFFFLILAKVIRFKSLKDKKSIFNAIDDFIILLFIYLFFFIKTSIRICQIFYLLFIVACVCICVLSHIQKLFWFNVNNMFFFLFWSMTHAIVLFFFLIFQSIRMIKSVETIDNI